MSDTPVSDESDAVAVSVGDNVPSAAVDPTFPARANAELDAIEETIADLERTLAALNAGNTLLADRAEHVRALDVEIGLLAFPPVAFAAPPPLPDPPIAEEPRREMDVPPLAEEAMEAEAVKVMEAAEAVEVVETNVPEIGDLTVPDVPDGLRIPPRTIAEVGAEWDDADITDGVLAEPLPTPEAAPSQPEEEPEPFVAVVTEGGDVLTAHPGEEPLLEEADALPAAPEPHEAAASLATRVVAPEPEPEMRMPPLVAEPLPAVASQPVVPVPVSASAPVSPSAIDDPLPSRPVIAPAPVSPPATDDALAGIRRHIAVGDVAAAVALGRSALGVAGKDTARVRALLPALRIIVAAAPTRPDAHRLLGDAYRRLGQMPQAQGQYQQALLMRVAGKK